MRWMYSLIKFIVRAMWKTGVFLFLLAVKVTGNVLSIYG